MNLFTLQQRFSTHNRCIKHLEKVKWGKHPVCPHCESDRITPRKSRKYFYHCNNCNKDFTVLYDTIFESSKLTLPKWFALITMMLNARKGISSAELSRQLGVTYKTAWYSAMRVRCAMIDEGDLLEGIVEMDETYVGGKPRKRAKNTDDSSANLSNVYKRDDVRIKRGRGTRKVPVVGIVEREGKKRVVAEVAGRLTTKNMLALLKKYVNQEKSIMMTDEARFYKGFDDVIQHLVIKHKEKFTDGPIHTNTIEGFWSIIKNGIRGEYHVLSKKYLPFYLAEFAYKYNRRSKEGKAEAFDDTIENAVTDDNLMVNYKPKVEIAKTKRRKKGRKKTRKESDATMVKRLVNRVRKRKISDKLEEAKKIVKKTKKKKKPPG